MATLVVRVMERYRDKKERQYTPTTQKYEILYKKNPDMPGF
jgi:hypothetical protein